MGTLVIAVQVYRWHKVDDHFDLRDLLTDKGAQRLSLAKTGQFVALCVSTWALANETLAGRLTEWLFTAYMLSWCGANIASTALRIKADSK